MSGPKVLNIDFGKEAPFHSGFGVLTIEQLREDAKLDEAPAAIKRDWYLIADWLGSSGGALSDQDRLHIEEGWRAYVSMGLAPSERLQPMFDQFSQELAGMTATRPPKEVLDVFGRLLATDEEIAVKRTADVRLEREMLQKVFDESKPRRQQRKERHNNRNVRRIVFLCALWMAGVFLYAWLFDPLHVGGWDELQDDDFTRLWVISLLPPIGAMVYKAYREWVP